MFNNPTELAIIGFLVIMLFGTKKLPELGSGLGQAISNFKKSFRENSAIDVTPEKDKVEEEKKPEIKN